MRASLNTASGTQNILLDQQYSKEDAPELCKSSLVLWCLLSTWPWSPSVDAQTLLGGNKFDLFSQYLGYANHCDGTPPCVRVTRDLAIKAIADASDAGLGFLRLGIAGWSPDRPGQSGELSVWRASPQLYWQTMDAMFDMLDHSHVRIVPVFVWNIVQFPVIVHDTVGTMIRDPNSRSRHLLREYIRDFVQRYRSRGTILFYELTNEMNLAADIDSRAICLEENPASQRDRCAALDNFSSAEMVAFSRDVVTEILQLDPTRGRFLRLCRTAIVGMAPGG